MVTIATLDAATDAAEKVEEAIEGMLTALDALRDAARDEGSTAVFADTEHAASLAEARYRLWLHDGHSITPA